MLKKINRARFFFSNILRSLPLYILPKHFFYPLLLPLYILTINRLKTMQKWIIIKAHYDHNKRA